MISFHLNYNRLRFGCFVLEIPVTSLYACVASVVPVSDVICNKLDEKHCMTLLRNKFYFSFSFNVANIFQMFFTFNILLLSKLWIFNEGVDIFVFTNLL